MWRCQVWRLALVALELPRVTLDEDGNTTSNIFQKVCMQNKALSIIGRNWEFARLSFFRVFLNTPYGVEIRDHSTQLQARRFWLLSSYPNELQ
ncbi:hypothetical protein BJX76DRAFT_327972 [Aspergillus varians]